MSLSGGCPVCSRFSFGRRSAAHQSAALVAHAPLSGECKAPGWDAARPRSASLDRAITGETTPNFQADCHIWDSGTPRFGVAVPGPAALPIKGSPQGLSGHWRLPQRQPARLACRQLAGKCKKPGLAAWLPKSALFPAASVRRRSAPSAPSAWPAASGSRAAFAAHKALPSQGLRRAGASPAAPFHLHPTQSGCGL